MEHAITVLMLAVGMALHVLKKVMDARDADPAVTLRDYLRRAPYATAYSGLAAIALYVVLATAGQLNEASALGAGFAADSMLRERLRRAA